MNKKKIHCMLSGICGGLVNGLLGTGGGIVLNLIFMHLLKMEQKKSMATALLVMPLFSVISVIGLWGRVEIDWALTGWLTAGGAAGAFFGGRYLKKIPVLWLKRIFGLALIWAGIRGVFF